MTATKQIIHMIGKHNRRTMCGKTLWDAKFHSNLEEIVSCPICLKIMNESIPEIKDVYNKKKLNYTEIDKALNPLMWHTEDSVYDLE